MTSSRSQAAQAMARSRSASPSAVVGRKRRQTSPAGSPQARRARRDSRSPRRDHDHSRQEGRTSRRDGGSRPARDARQDIARRPRHDNGAPAGAADGPALPTGPAAAGGGAPAVAQVAKEAKPTRAGGVYIPPFKLAQMMREHGDKDKSSKEYQRMTWDALRKSLNGLVNKINAQNIKVMLPQIFGENLVRGRGLLVRTLMKSQLASPEFTAVFAALVAVINCKLPEVGELLLKRIVWQLRRAFERNDRPILLGCLSFLGHLVNQQVAHEVLALEVLMLLLETPSDDSVEAALAFLDAVGATLQDTSSKAMFTILEQIRRIMHEGRDVEPRTALVMQTWYRRFANKATWAQEHPALTPELDLVDVEDQITHNIDLLDEIDREIRLDIFREDQEFAQHEREYEAIKREILGEDSEEEGGGDRDDDGEEGSDDEEAAAEAEAEEEEKMRIQDQTQTNLINLRRTIYLTIMSSLDFEESGHKLLKINLAEDQRIEIVTMLIECCSQEKTYVKYYGLLSERFCKLSRDYQALFEDCFRKQYALIHRLETNKLRNVARLFAHLLCTDAISWGVLSHICITEDDTTSSSRIFIKIMFQALSEDMGLIALNARLGEPSLQAFFEGVFPRDSAKNMRFSINFFTSIGLGGLTDRMRDYLATELPRIAAERAAAAAAAARAAASSSSSDDSSSSSGDSSSSDDSSDDSSSSGSGGSSSDSSSSDDSSSDDSSSSDSDSSSSDSEDRRKHRKRGSKQAAAPSNGRSRQRDELPPPPQLMGRHGKDRDGHRDGDGAGERSRRQLPGPPPGHRGRQAGEERPSSRRGRADEDGRPSNGHQQPHRHDEHGRHSDGRRSHRRHESPGRHEDDDRWRG